MTQQNPGPRAAARAFAGTFGQTAIDALTAVMAGTTTLAGAWDAEDSLHAYANHTAPDRAAWLAYEVALAGASDPDTALA